MRALISVYNKKSLVVFARSLVKLKWEIIASGGTAKLLKKNKIPVITVAKIINHPEILGGRVKTLHPAIHGGILATGSEKDKKDLKKLGISPIDLVVCNLYPFTDTVSKPNVTLDEAVEQIDIGGVTLLRAAAKNFARVTVICDPNDYELVLQEFKKRGKTKLATRSSLAVKAFQTTRNYDAAISGYLNRSDNKENALPDNLYINLHKVQTLRYGENPHQIGALYGVSKKYKPLGGVLLQGKELSYNNLLDLDLAYRAVKPYKRSAVVIVKHLCPCGIAVSSSIASAFPKALASDPISAFGGILAVNEQVDMEFVNEIKKAKLFIEAIIAPKFTPKAIRWFSEKKKNCRLIELAQSKKTKRTLEIRSISNGFVVHEQDTGDPENTKWKVTSKRKPTTNELKALKFAWLAASFVKSNAIVFAKSDRTVGIGGGLTSRVDAVRLAAEKAGVKSKGAVMASDAFFPFPDAIDEAVKAGITAIIQPGGSIRDKLVIDTVNKHNLAMIFTGVRHFRH